MAFNPNLLTKVVTGNGSNTQAFADFITTNLTTNLLPPQFWLYQGGSDAIATVSAAGYFNYFADWLNTLVYNNGFYLRVGDLIYCKASDGDTWLTVTAVGATITTAPLGAGPDSVGTADIQDSAITTAKIAAANVTLAKLAAGITPSHVIKYASQLTTVGGAAAEAFAVAGAVAATDRAFVQVVNDGTNNRTVLQAVVTNNTLTITFSGDPGNDLVFNYQIIRAAA